MTSPSRNCAIRHLGPSATIGAAFGIVVAVCGAAPLAAQDATGGGSGFPAELFDPGGDAAPIFDAPSFDASGGDAAPAAGGDSSAARRLEKAERALGLALPKERLAEMLGALRPALERQIRDEAARRGKTLTPEIAARLIGLMREELNLLYARMFPRLPPLYAEALTEPELDRLLELYGSPEGRSMLAKLDGLSLRLADEMQPYIAVYRNRLRERLTSELEALE